MKRAIASDNILNCTDKSVLEYQRDYLMCHHQLHKLGYDSDFAAFLPEPIIGSIGPNPGLDHVWSRLGFEALHVDYMAAAEENITPSISSDTSRSENFKKRKLERVKRVGALMEEDDKEKKNKKMIRGFEEEEEEEKSKVTEETIGSIKNITKKKKATKKQQRSSNCTSKNDYIHVRARRGQATDSHSLAERVRREKISEKMKFLQDLVPGCNKITGKAGMLDEIINYVQSLQSQIEFLSMKLAVVNPRPDFEEAVEDIFDNEAIPVQQVVNSGYLQFNPMQQVVQSSGTETTINMSGSDPMWDSEMHNILYGSLGFHQELSPLTTFSTKSQQFSGRFDEYKNNLKMEM